MSTGHSKKPANNTRQATLSILCAKFYWCHALHLICKYTNQVGFWGKVFVCEIAFFMTTNGQE